MVNVLKIKSLCKEKGIKQGWLCQQLGLAYVYLNDVAKGKSAMPDDRIRQIAVMLGTTYEYLTDQTDDPERPEDYFEPKSEAEVIRMTATNLLEQIDDLDKLNQMIAIMKTFVDDNKE